LDAISGEELRRAARAGTVVEGRQDGARRTLDAAIVRRHCLEPAGQVDPHGIRIRGAIISGRLDLAAVSVLFPLVFEDCEFEQAPNLDGASLHALTFRGCSLPGLIGNGLRVRRDVDLSDSLITGAHSTSASATQRAAVWLCEAEIGGRSVPAPGSSATASGRSRPTGSRWAASSA
jgi:hypothetical protein